MSFSEIPILDLSEARTADTKPAFLTKLRDALLNVGFLYIKNFGIDQELCDRVCEEGIKFFDLPDEEKLRIEMKNQASFLGYSRVRCDDLHELYFMANQIHSNSLGMRSQHRNRTGESNTMSPHRIQYVKIAIRCITTCLRQINGQRTNFYRNSGLFMGNISKKCQT